MGMSLFKRAAKAYFGWDEATHRDLADPNCPLCKGSGLIAGSVDCHCYQEGVKAAVREAAWQSGLREKERRLAESPQQRRERVLGPPLPPPESGEVRPLTPPEQAQKDLEGRLMASLPRDQRMAMYEGALSVCCASDPCRCGVNHWHDRRPSVNDWQGPFDDEVAQAPPPDHPAYPHWRAHQAEVYSRPNLLAQEREQELDAMATWVEDLRRRNI
jgi:hypothetical protein